LQQIFYKRAFGGTISPSEMFLEEQIWFGISLHFPHYSCSDATFMVVSAAQQFNSFHYVANHKKKEG